MSVNFLMMFDYEAKDSPSISIDFLLMQFGW